MSMTTTVDPALRDPLGHAPLPSTSLGIGLSPAAASAAVPSTADDKVQSSTWFWDYLELTKPKIAALELVAVTVAAVVASAGSLNVWVLLNTLIGTALVAASASALNQWLEVESDRRMPRTASRPLPAGRLTRREVALFGIVTVVLGLSWLLLAVNLRTAAVGLLTWGLYVWVYTPLKSRTAWNTHVGAVAGALPVMMGWAAVGGRFDLAAATLFLIVFLWQFPHFMAIAWIYRREYSAAGLQMLSVVDPSGRRAGVQALCSALALIPASLFPAVVNAAGPWYLAGALLLSLGQLICTVWFLRRLSESAARTLLRASLVYLPALLLLLMLGPWI